MDPIFKAKVKDGKVVTADRDLLQIHLKTLEGMDVDLIVRKQKKDRTNQQNRWYWVAVVGIPALHFGYLPEEMHDAYKWMFLRRFEDGKPETVKSTTKLTTVEFNEYAEKCRTWAAEQGIVIPDPHAVYTE